MTIERSDEPWAIWLRGEACAAPDKEASVANDQGECRDLRFGTGERRHAILLREGDGVSRVKRPGDTRRPADGARMSASNGSLSACIGSLLASNESWQVSNASPLTDNGAMLADNGAMLANNASLLAAHGCLSACKWDLSTPDRRCRSCKWSLLACNCPLQTCRRVS